MPVTIEEITQQHNRNAFDCGVTELNQYLKQQARQKTVKQISAIGLFVDPMTPQIAPFYQRYGFLPAVLDDHSRLEMWLPIKTCTEIANTLL